MTHRALEPLGIDLGTRRVRIAVGERTPRGTVVRAVAARDLPTAELPDESSEEISSIVIEDLVRELGVKKKECVTALGSPAATLRAARFPRMTYVERKRAATFQTEESASESRVTRVHPIDVAAGEYAVASASHVTLRHRVATLRKAGLRVIGVDYDGCSFRRIFGDDLDALIDVGHEATRLHVFANFIPSTVTSVIGGAAMTRAIAKDLSIEVSTAERRKRILGFSGTSERTLREIIDELADLLKDARIASETSNVGMVGNGARLPGLAQALSETCGLPIALPIPELLRNAHIADDALQSAAADWSLAGALTTWKAP